MVTIGFEKAGRIERQEVQSCARPEVVEANGPRAATFEGLSFVACRIIGNIIFRALNYPRGDRSFGYDIHTP